MVDIYNQTINLGVPFAKLYRYRIRNSSIPLHKMASLSALLHLLVELFCIKCRYQSFLIAQKKTIKKMVCGDENHGSNKCRYQSFLIAQKKAIKKWFAGTQTMDQNNFFGAALFYIYNFLILCYFEPPKCNIIHTLQCLFVKAIDIIDDYIISIRIIKIACH